MNENNKVFFLARKTQTRATAIIIAVKISSVDRQWYKIPVELQPYEKHEELMKTPSAKGIIPTIEGPRVFHVLARDNILVEYLDEEENFRFKDKYLVPDTKNELNVFLGNNPDDEDKRRLEKKIDEMEKQLQAVQTKKNHWKLRDIEKKLIIEKFKGKQGPEDWLERFENECERNEINDGETTIEALFYFVEDAAKDWYMVARKQLKDLPWIKWKEAMINNFENRTWQSAKTAFGYRYLKGTYTEYAFRKQRMCIEECPDVTESALIILIIMGLPTNITNRIDRSNIKSMSDLTKKLAGFPSENLTEKDNEKDKNKLFKPFQGSRFNQKQNEPNRECTICAKAGFAGRLHKESNCWHRNKNSKQANLYEEMAKEEEQTNEEKDRTPLNMQARHTD